MNRNELFESWVESIVQSMNARCVPPTQTQEYRDKSCTEDWERYEVRMFGDPDMPDGVMNVIMYNYVKDVWEAVDPAEL